MISYGRMEPTSALNCSRGKPSTALMLSCESGWTTAKPPETVQKKPVVSEGSFLGMLAVMTT